ncbi:ComGF family competence protein, partial [Staphylococcus arlettae]
TQYIELELFARDITQSIVTSQHKLTIIHPQKFSIATSKNQTYSYSYKNGKVIKQVNDTGYIILLNNVLSFRVATIATHHLAIHLKLVEKGEYFEKTIYL